MHPLISQITTQHAPMHQQRNAEESPLNAISDHSSGSTNESFERFFERDAGSEKNPEPQTFSAGEQQENTDVDLETVAANSDASSIRKTAAQPTAQRSVHSSVTLNTLAKNPTITSPMKNQPELLTTLTPIQRPPQTQATPHAPPQHDYHPTLTQPEMRALGILVQGVSKLAVPTTGSTTTQLEQNTKSRTLDQAFSIGRLSANHPTSVQLDQNSSVNQTRSSARSQTDGTTRQTLKGLSVDKNSFLPDQTGASVRSKSALQVRREFIETAPAPVNRWSTPAAPQNNSLPTTPIKEWQSSKPLGADQILPSNTDAPTNTGSLQNATPTRTELPIHIARQLADVVQHAPPRPVEITLSPEELGRVRLSVASSESGIIVNVLAERPETLDLMRRHIDQLAQEFQDLGYQDIAFSFSEAEHDPSDDRGDSSPEDQTSRSSSQANETATATDQIHLSAGNTTGLDLRL